MREQKSTFILPDFRLCCNKSARLSSVARNRVLDCPENKARLLGATVSQRFVGAGFPRPRLYLLAFVTLLCKRAGKPRPYNLFQVTFKNPRTPSLHQPMPQKCRFEVGAIGRRRARSWSKPRRLSVVRRAS